MSIFFYLIIEIVLLVAFRKVLRIALERMKHCKNIQNLKYFKTEEFFVVSKGSRRNNHVNYRWITISTENGKYEDTVSATDNLELCENFNRVNNFSRKDIYVYNTINDLYITCQEGEKSDLLGQDAFIESIIFLFIAAFIVFSGFMIFII